MFEVNVVLEEIFSWEGERETKRWWHVGLAKMFCNAMAERGRGPMEITHAQAAEALSHNCHAQGLDTTGADYSVPAIAITMFNPKMGRDEQILIDGWHRLKKFVEEKQDGDVIPVFVIPKEVSTAIEDATAEMMGSGMGIVIPR